MSIGEVRVIRQIIIMEGHIYILKSLKNNSYYIGSTEDLANRFREHSIGLVKSTRLLLPWIISFSQEYPTIKEARQIEYKLKRLKSRKIIERIITDNEIKIRI